MVTATDDSTARKSKFDDVAIAKMKDQLLAEPKIRDLVFNGEGGVAWQIGVDDDGTSRFGYALFVCTLLAEQRLVDEDTDVRIVDLAKLAQSRGDFGGSSLGHVRCRDGEDLGV